MNNLPIGIFDSGLGGLSVFAELIKLLPDENYIYFGDTLNLPYGNKTFDELISITSNIFDFFEFKNTKAVVMACNTTSAITYDVLKTKYKYKIYPLVQNVSKEIAEQNFKKIGVFATQATINSHAYKKEINKYSPQTEVVEIACPNWVNIVENSLQNNKEAIDDIKRNLDIMINYNIEKIVLGCTHYPYLLNILSEFVPKNMFINPAEIFAKQIFINLKLNNLLAEKKFFEPKFYVSSNPNQFKTSSKLFYDVQNVELISQEKILNTSKVIV